MKKHRKCKKIIAFVTVLFIAFVAVIGLHKTGIYRFDFLKDIYKKIDFQLSTNELNIPQDALSFSVYDIEQEEYLFYEGDSQLPTVASLAKLFAIDYALGKVDLEDIVEVNQVIMLRPTQSPIVFIQQLGRGLRKAEGKEYVVILDFIGNYKNNFMIPIALFGDRSYNKDNIRRYLREGSRVIPGASTIHFDSIRRKLLSFFEND